MAERQGLKSAARRFSLYGAKIWSLPRRLTTHSTGLAISLPFIIKVDCSPVIRALGAHLLQTFNDMNDDLRVSVISPPDRELLAAEIMLGDEQLAELNQETGVFSLEIYPRRDGQPWRISYEAMLEALTKAKERLAGES